MIKTITTTDLELLIRNTRIIDLRDQDFYYLGHIEGACWLPYELLNTHAEMLIHPEEMIILYDAGGTDTRARHAAESLQAQGYDKLYVYAEGWAGWEKSHPTALKDTFMFKL